MADLSDVVQVLAQLAANAAYPNGMAQPSVTGGVVTVVPGWPVPDQLDAIMAAGNAMVSVYPMPGMDANTKRFPTAMQPQTGIQNAGLTMTVSGLTVTIGGVINAGEAAAVSVNYNTYSYGVLSNSTTASIAAGLAALIPGATVSGSVLTLPFGTYSLSVAVSVPVLMQAEIGRQTRVFQIIGWCASATIRNALMKAIDLAFRQQPRITMPDNVWARLIYRGTLESDELGKMTIYRRDLRYEVEYATMITETDNTVVSLTTTTTIQ